MSLLDSIIHWAQHNEAIQVVLLTGSKASLKGSDAFSDDDIALFGNRFDFIANDKWLDDIGPFQLCIHDQFHANGFEIPTRLVIFEGFAKADFSFHPLAELQQLVAAGQLPDDYNVGYKVLLDKSGFATGLPAPTYTGFKIEKPSEAQFGKNMSEFFFEIWHVIKYLRRSELWAAQNRHWACLKWLRQMLEWQEGHLRNWNFSPRRDGKDMMQWLPQGLQRELAGCFPEFDTVDMQKALLHMVSLYRTIAVRLAQDLGYTYNEPLGLIDSILPS